MHEFYFAQLSEQRLAEEQRIYRKEKAELKAKIEAERKKLNEWLSSHEKSVYHGIVKEIYKVYFLNEDDAAYESLNYDKDRLADVCAVNLAIHGGSVKDLEVRSRENMESRSLTLQGFGVLLGMLAVSLAITGAMTLNPIIIFFAGMAALASYAAYSIGSGKVSTTKSTLFSDLKEAISPTPPPPILPYSEDPSLMESGLMGLQYVPSKYGIY